MHSGIGCGGVYVEMDCKVRQQRSQSVQNRDSLNIQN